MIGYYTIYYKNGEKKDTFDIFINERDLQIQLEIISKKEDVNYVELKDINEYLPFFSLIQPSIFTVAP